MSEDSSAANSDLEETAREWLTRRRTGDIDESKLADGFPRGDGELERAILRLLGEPTSLTFIQSSTNYRGITTHRFRLTFAPVVEYRLGFMPDGKLNQFSIMMPPRTDAPSDKR